MGRACPRSRAVTASQSIRGRWQRSSDCPSARWIQFARCRESCRRARPSEFRRGPRARRFRPEPQQRSTREWLSASFPAPAPEAASSPSPPRPELHWPGRRKPRSTDPQASEHPQVKRRKPWECFRPWRVPRFASLTWMPSFERLPILPPDLASAIGGEGASFWAIWSKAEQVCDLGPIQRHRPSQCKACRQRHRGEQDGARAIAVWLTQHQHVIAIAAQDIATQGIPQARRLPRQRAGSDIFRPAVFKGTRLAVLHGVT